MPSVARFCQFPVVFLQLPVVGAAKGRQVVDVGGAAVVPKRSPTQPDDSNKPSPAASKPKPPTPRI